MIKPKFSFLSEYSRMMICKQSLFPQTLGRDEKSYETCCLDPSCVQLGGAKYNCIVAQLIKGIFISHEVKAVSLLITKSLLYFPWTWLLRETHIGVTIQCLSLVMDLFYLVYTVKTYSCWAGQMAQWFVPIRIQIWSPAPKSVSSHSSVTPLPLASVGTWIHSHIPTCMHAHQWWW